MIFPSRFLRIESRVLRNIRIHRQCRKMSSSCRVAVLQLSCSSDKIRNREKCYELLCKAKDFGAEAAFLPEAFDFVGESAKQTVQLAEELQKENGTVAYFKGNQNILMPFQFPEGSYIPVRKSIAPISDLISNSNFKQCFEHQS